MLPDTVLILAGGSVAILTMPGFGVLGSKSNGVWIILGPSLRHCKILVPIVFILGANTSETQSNIPISN